MDERPYTIVYSQEADSFLFRLERSQPNTYDHIDRTIDHLAYLKSDYPRIKSLRGPQRDYYRIRAANQYRIVFRFDHHRGLLFITDVNHRKDVYRP